MVWRFREPYNRDVRRLRHGRHGQAFTGQRAIAEFGIGLAAAVALGAFVLRTVLVPAAMHLFGDANWWLSRWLDRLLPHLGIEPRAHLPIERPEGVGRRHHAPTGMTSVQHRC